MSIKFWYFQNPFFWAEVKVDFTFHWSLFRESERVRTWLRNDSEERPESIKDWQMKGRLVRVSVGIWIKCVQLEALTLFGKDRFNLFLLQSSPFNHWHSDFIISSWLNKTLLFYSFFSSLPLNKHFSSSIELNHQITNELYWQSGEEYASGNLDLKAETINQSPVALLNLQSQVHHRWQEIDLTQLVQ
jgi:hypothetical protein